MMAQHILYNCINNSTVQTYVHIIQACIAHYRACEILSVEVLLKEVLPHDSGTYELSAANCSITNPNRVSDLCTVRFLDMTSS
jgi:hypothetical protein